MKTTVQKLFISMMLFMVSCQMTAQDTGQKWLAAARQGSVNAMYHTAMNYYMGSNGLPEDLSKARYWAEKGGEMGNVKCMEVAIMLYDDAKQQLFQSKRLYWAEKAGKKGSIDAMLQARSIYTIIKGYMVTYADKRKCIERGMYWNDKMLAHPEYDAREQGLEIKKDLERELAKLNGTPSSGSAASVASGTDDPVYDIVEQNAEFPGGVSACYQWISQNMHYPAIAMQQNIQGRVLVTFVVNTDGSIVEVEAKRSPDPSLSEEAVRVVRAMPKWKPAQQSGKFVRSRFNLPIMFKLTTPKQ